MFSGWSKYTERVVEGPFYYIIDHNLPFRTTIFRPFVIIFRSQLHVPNDGTPSSNTPQIHTENSQEISYGI